VCREVVILYTLYRREIALRVPMLGGFWVVEGQETSQKPGFFKKPGF
jgi:hypothetical protein